MEDDTCPRLAPPPKPTLQEMSKAKPVVPEVSLLLTDYDDSYSWQPPSHKVQPDTKPHTVQSDHKKEESQLIENMHNINKQGNSSSVDHSPATHTLGSVTNRPLNKFRIGFSVPGEKCYNPLAYSPSPKRSITSPVTTITPHLPAIQNIHHLPKQVSSNQQPLTCQSPDKFCSHPMRHVESTVTSHQVTIQHAMPPLTTKSGAAHVRSVPAMASEIVIGQKNECRTNMDRYDKETIESSSLLASQVSPIQTDVAGLQEINVNTEGTRCPQTSAPSSSQSNQRTPVIQNTKPNMISRRELQRPESPCGMVGNTTISSDHFMYQLIEDNNKQIQNLSKTIEMLMERQKEAVVSVMPDKQQTEKVLYARGNLGNKGVQNDVCVQTVTSEQLKTRSVGVNTDVTWSELVASIRNNNQFGGGEAIGSSFMEEHKKSAVGCADHDLRQNRMTPSRETSQKYGSNQTLDEQGQLLIHGDATITSQEDYQELHQPLPPHASCGGANSSPSYTLRNSENEETQEGASGVVLRDSVLSVPGNQTSCAGVSSSGINFYDNILANIQHILQNSDTAQEVTQLQQQTLHEHPQQSSQRERPVGESHVEALRKQLIQFGISFVDPGTLTDHPQGMMDTMYLPRVHNMLSLYQSAVSTHYHPGQPRVDATTAKYLTDSQLAAIAAKSSVMVTQDGNRRGQGSPLHSPPATTTTQETSGQLYRFTVSNNVSMSSINFLEKYGLKEDQ